MTGKQNGQRGRNPAGRHSKGNHHHTEYTTADAVLYSVGTESAALAAVMEEPPTLSILRQYLQPEDFGGPLDRAVYIEMCALADKGVPHDDEVALIKALERAGVTTDEARSRLYELRMGGVGGVALRARQYCLDILSYAERRVRAELQLLNGEAYLRDYDSASVADRESPLLARLADIQRRAEGEGLADDTWQPDIQSAQDLLREEIAPARWAVPDLFAEGLNLFAGKAKRGKSTLILGVLSAVALGGVVLGKIRVERGEALYLALEDNKRRMKERLERQLDIDDASRAPKALHIAYKWPRLDMGGIEALDRWMDAHTETRIICIDTFKPLKPRQRSANMSMYDADYEALQPIQEWATRRHVAVVMIMHLRKSPNPDDAFDEINGSMGLQGVADNMVVMRDFNGEYTLHRRGRDYLDDDPWAITGDRETLLWQIVGKRLEEEQHTVERGALYELLDRHPEGLTPREVAGYLGKSSGAVRIMLHRAMQQAQGGIRKFEGRYYRESNSSNGGNESNSSNGGNSGPKPETVTHSASRVTGNVTVLRPDVARFGAISVTGVTPVTHAPLCAYPAHRDKWQWIETQNRMVCAVCHPLPAGMGVS